MRYHELDALRAFAMLLGIFWHVAVIANVLPETDSGVRNTAVSFFVQTAHAIRLPVFFVMAGFFAALVVSRTGARAFASARLRRIGIPLVVGVVVLVPMINAVTIWSMRSVWHAPHQSVSVGDFLAFQPHHLWFLEYLLVFYAVVLGARRVRQHVPWATALGSRAFAFVATSRLRLLLLVPPLALVWSSDALWFFQGVDESFIPSPAGVLYYGAFFAFGYVLYANRELLPAVRADHRGYTVLALAAASVAMLTSGLVLAVALVTVAWSATFALMGWFAIWFRRPSARVRYMADAAFWLYLVHVPLVGFLYLELTALNVPLPIKLFGVPVVVVLALLFVYEHAVRYSAVGRVLHGPRVRGA